MRFDTRQGWRSGSQKMMKIWKFFKFIKPEWMNLEVYLAWIYIIWNVVFGRIMLCESPWRWSGWRSTAGCKWGIFRQLIGLPDDYRWIHKCSFFFQKTWHRRVWTIEHKRFDISVWHQFLLVRDSDSELDIKTWHQHSKTSLWHVFFDISTCHQHSDISTWYENYNWTIYHVMTR